MKVVSVVGARPQFIKCAPVSRELRKVATEVLVHTGQHYDDSMSEVFFRELDIPKPEYNLGVGSGPHGAQTGAMLRGIEEALVKEEPDWALVYGDTNSTLAGALAAAKLHVPVAHVEAGLRSLNRRMPEEINRVLTDHLSSLLLCPTPTAVENLRAEGIEEGVHLVGDVMYEALFHNLGIAESRSTILERLMLRPNEYFLATVHRAENTEGICRLRNIVEAFRRVGTTHPVVWPLHPRTHKALVSVGEPLTSNHAMLVVDPVSYFDMLVLEKHAKAILTDSGGVQKEAFWLQVPCVTLREETEWVETVQAGWNALVGCEADRIVAAAFRTRPNETPPSLYGDSHAAARIVACLAGAPE